MSHIANNHIAQAYNRIQSGYCDASEAGRIQILLKLKQLLTEAPSHTPIFDHECYDHTTGQRIYISASEQLDNIIRHLSV